MNVARNGLVKIAFHMILLPFTLAKSDRISIRYAQKSNLD